MKSHFELGLGLPSSYATTNFHKSFGPAMLSQDGIEDHMNFLFMVLGHISLSFISTIIPDHPQGHSTCDSWPFWPFIKRVWFGPIRFYLYYANECDVVLRRWCFNFFAVLAKIRDRLNASTITSDNNAIWIASQKQSFPCIVISEGIQPHPTETRPFYVFWSGYDEEGRLL